jgi:hypothetical protein
MHPVAHYSTHFVFLVGNVLSSRCLVTDHLLPCLWSKEMAADSPQASSLLTPFAPIKYSQFIGTDHISSLVASAGYLTDLIGNTIAPLVLTSNAKQRQLYM